MAGNGRFVMWGRKHSMDRVHTRGDWMGLGALVPVVTPFQEPPAPAGREPDPELERAAPNGRAQPCGLRDELERAAKAGGELEATRGRGRPRKGAR